ncbi:DNA-3-methyladenine glycosylase 2 [Companilactobacillus furfuricola]|uniref:DNA-3-methyladenine glycosylase 2 n=1 Tax=Companilactobacillus furfuricola TaxID=1462575 RepID=UPI000F790BC1|nr:DNA glycosylase [Companilactobacillus furfuricola]
MRADFVLPVPAIFSWAKILKYLRRDPNELAYRIVGRRIRRAFVIDGKKVLCEIMYHPRLKTISVTILNQVQVTENIRQQLQDFVTEWFDLDQDLSTFYEMAQTDPILKKVLKKQAGLRLVGIPDLFEALVWEIVGQEITVNFALSLKQNFIKRFGQTIDFQDSTYWIFPSAEIVAEASKQELLDLKLTNHKAEYLLDISSKIASGNMTKQEYRKYDNFEDAEKAMTKIRGIGPWTANCILMCCIKQGDAFPMNDVGLLNGIQTLEKSNQKPSKEKMLQLKKRWGNWCSYAVFYIWNYFY